MTAMLSVDLTGLHAMLDQMGDAAEAVARPAAQAAAQVFYNEVKRNVAAIPERTGNLDRSIYQVYSANNSGTGKATYHVSWNVRKAPHGHLVENGHVQRYVTYVGRDGNVYTAKRRESYGKPKPRRRASQAEKDAYYLPLPTPKQVPARAFVRRAQSKAGDAVEAAKRVILEALNNAA
jgi:hypothetical protein